MNGLAIYGRAVVSAFGKFTVTYTDQPVDDDPPYAVFRSDTGDWMGGDSTRAGAEAYARELDGILRGNP